MLQNALGCYIEAIDPVKINRLLDEMKLANLDAWLVEIGLGNAVNILIAKKLLGEIASLTINYSANKQLSIQGCNDILVSCAKTIRTADGDILDDICLTHYGHFDRTMEIVLSANPGLSAIGQPFKAGIKIVLPTINARQESTIKLWN